MNKVWSLVKISLQSNIAFLSHKNAKAWLVLSILASIILGVILFGIVNIVVHFLYGVLAPIGQENFILGFGLTISTFIIFFLNINNVLKVFFYSEDLEHLLPLPFLPSEILSAKFIVLLFPSYFINFLITGPILLSYGIVGGKGILYFLYSIIIFFLLPVLPIVLMAIIIMIVMRYTNMSKNKDRTKIIGGILSIIFAIGINIIIRQQSININMEEVIEGWVGEGSLLEQITTYFPTSYLGAKALDSANSFSGFLYLLGLVLLTVIVLGIFLTLGQRIYYKSVMGLNTASVSKKRKEGNYQKQGAVLFSYLKKEMKMLMRTPAFFIGCVVQTFNMPIIMFVILFMDHDVSMNPTEAGFGKGSTFILVLLTTFLVLSFNQISITSISREGTNWFTNKYLPIEATTIIYGKALAGWALQTFILLVGGVLLHVVMHYSIGFLILWFIISCLNAFLSNVVEVYLNAKNPNLHWENEQQALKGMGKHLLNLLIRLLFYGGIFLITLLIALFTTFHIAVVFGSLLILYLIALYAMKLFVARTAEEVINDVR